MSRNSTDDPINATGAGQHDRLQKKKTSHTQLRRKGRTGKKSADHRDLEKIGRTDVMVQRHRYVADEESVY